ncbi:hypothetical protein FocTR4_00002610 [Fusarium oxysporum f. sp. cubense]|uniref:Uncharacterized protein n=1 Tax=Fusarium oxysporum f. sp. cubense TaxID=61366 RepID=A0A5C6TCA5_FUSOC|nr:hypothetical protein FocTR4_00002610 [Fusarium oxysporum f. sp. cubense]
MQGRKKPVVLLSGPREGSDAEQHAGDWVGPGKADPRRDDVPSSQQREAAGSSSNRSKKGVRRSRSNWLSHPTSRERDKVRNFSCRKLIGDLQLSSAWLSSV